MRDLYTAVRVLQGSTSLSDDLNIRISEECSVSCNEQIPQSFLGCQIWCDPLNIDGSRLIDATSQCSASHISYVDNEVLPWNSCGSNE